MKLWSEEDVAEPPGSSRKEAVNERGGTKPAMLAEGGLLSKSLNLRAARAPKSVLGCILEVVEEKLGRAVYGEGRSPSSKHDDW